MAERDIAGSRTRCRGCQRAATDIVTYCSPILTGALDSVVIVMLSRQRSGSMLRNIGRFNAGGANLKLPDTNDGKMQSHLPAPFCVAALSMVLSWPSVSAAPHAMFNFSLLMPWRRNLFRRHMRVLASSSPTARPFTKQTFNEVMR